MMVYINDVFAQVCNVNISDETAHMMIEEAALSAAAQVREECHRRRLAEKHNARERAERMVEQQREEQNTRIWREKEAEISRRRTAALLEVERQPPQKKTRPWG